MADSIDTILNGPRAENPEAQASPAETPNTSPAEQATQSEALAPVSEPAPKPEPKPEPPSVPLASLMDERKKRQDLERRLQALEAASQPKEEGPDIFVDPDRWAGNLERKVRSEIEDKQWSQMCAMSEDLVRSTVGEAKYDQAMKAFEAEVEANPALAVSLRNAANPAKFAFDHGMRAIHLREIGDPVTYRDRLKAEILEELRQQSAGTKPAAPKPTSLAGMPSEGSVRPRWEGPTPLSSLLPR